MKRLVLLSILAIAWTLQARALSIDAHEEAPLRHYYYLDDAAAMHSLETNRERIDVLSPVWFSIVKGGALEPALDAHLLEWAAAHNLPLMPVLENRDFDSNVAHEFLTNPRVRDDVIVTLLKIAAVHHFYGIQLDFENLQPGDRDAYSNFTQTLGRGLHNLQMKLSVAVMSPLGPHQKTDGSWEVSAHSAAFDYFQLASEADLISLMAYDQHTEPDAPGPIASAMWVDACIRKVLEYVPSRKLLLGVPLYYRQWSKGTVSEGPFLQAQAMAANNHHKIEFDAVEAESNFRFDDDKGSHTIWLYDARALNLRIKLAAKYHLRGISAWRLGQEDPLFWGGQ